jgi:antitoxin VapB
MKATVAKIFMNGRSQAIRLPKEFRMEGTEVYIEKDKGRLIITPKTEKEIFEKAVDDLFGCCPDFDIRRDSVHNRPRKVNL